MHVVAMLKWTATIILVYISECHGLPVDQKNTSCVYSFHVPGSQAQAGCPGNGQSSEVLRLAESLTQVKSAIEVLQVIMGTKSQSHRIVRFSTAYHARSHHNVALLILSTSSCRFENVNLLLMLLACPTINCLSQDIFIGSHSLLLVLFPFALFKFSQIATEGASCVVYLPTSALLMCVSSRNLSHIMYEYYSLLLTDCLHALLFS